MTNEIVWREIYILIYITKGMKNRPTYEQMKKINRKTNVEIKNEENDGNM